MGILPHPAVVGHHLAPEIDEFGDAWIHGPPQSSARLTATLRPGRGEKPRLSSPAARPRMVAKCPLPNRRELTKTEERRVGQGLRGTFKSRGDAVTKKKK